VAVMCKGVGVFWLFFSVLQLSNCSEVSWSRCLEARSQVLPSIIYERAVAEGGILEDYYQVISREDEIKGYSGSQLPVESTFT